MYSKFENFMKKYLAPLADKMDKEVHLSAVKKAMVAMTPLLIIGSFCLIPEAIPNMIGEKHVISQWILTNLDIIYIPYNVGMALMSVYVTVIIAYQLANSYKLDIPGCVTMGLVSFLMLVVEFTEDGGISKTYLGPKGLFCAMFAGFIAVELFRWCKKKNFTIKMPDTVPDFVSRSFEMIPISVIIIGFFLIVRIVCVNVLNTMPPLIFTAIFAPLVGSMDNPIAYTFLKMLQALIFFFGIHPSVLSPITSPISTQFLAENIAAVQAGHVATHFYAPGPESAFGNFTGSGVTIGSLGGWAMYLGIMKCSTFTPPYVGVFLEGFLTNMDPMSIVVNAVQLILSILIWYPFVKSYEKTYGNKEETNAISAEDAAILDDLDLDF